MPYSVSIHTYVEAYDIGPKAIDIFKQADPRDDASAIRAAREAAAFLCQTLPKVEVNVTFDGALVKKWVAFPGDKIDLPYLGDLPRGHRVGR